MSYVNQMQSCEAVKCEMEIISCFVHYLHTLSVEKFWKFLWFLFEFIDII